MKIRCPVCGGSGGVEPGFGTVIVYDSYNVYSSDNKSAKPCPACLGTGMQEEGK